MKTNTAGNTLKMAPLLAAGAIALLGGWSASAQSVATYHQRADSALQSFLLKFWSGSNQYLENEYPQNGTLTGYWTYAQGWDAVLDGVERTGGEEYYGLVETFYLGQNNRGWTSSYYDDECWMALALIRAYDLIGTSKYLTEAENLFADIEGGWDTTCCGSNPGGVWWDKAHTQKATASNAGAALVGTLLYERTGNTSYLSFAEQVYSFWQANLVNSSTGQVADHLNTDGTIVWWNFTYDQGLMIGAGVELNQATGEPSYLNNAYSTANYLISSEVTSTSYGSVLYDGSNSGCGGDCHEFKGPAYRYLMSLYALNTNYSQYYNVLKPSADAIWNLANYSPSTIFAVNWAGPSQSSVDELQDNAACMALSRFAQQYGPYPGSGEPSNQFEAENGTLHNLGLEATHSGFTGWGYIAGWKGDGQWIDFTVNVSQAGTHKLTFRYAAGAGNASRYIYINGAGAVNNQSFPNTGSWSTYKTVSISHQLNAGMNTISVIYNSSLGSANYLNLDNLVVN